MIRERVVLADGVPLHCLEAGPDDGPLVVLLHGFPEHAGAWRRHMVPLAEAGFRVVAPDGRGYGRSGKPDGIAPYRVSRLTADVVAVADAYGAARVRLVGHDWGGIVAWWLAARHPERVARLAILNAPHPDTRWSVPRRHPGQWLRSWYVAAFQLPALPERLLAANGFAALAHALVGTSRPGTFGPADLEGYRAAWAEPGALRGMLAWYRALVRHPPRPAGRVRVPTLVLWGRRDTALLPAFAEHGAALADDVRLRWFDGASHWLHHEEPDAVAAELLAFLA